MHLIAEITNPNVILDLEDYFSNMSFNFSGGITKKLQSISWTRGGDLKLVAASGKETDDEPIVLSMQAVPIKNRKRGKKNAQNSDS